MLEIPILVVDDNEFIRASMVKFLETNRYNAVGVSHADDAMKQLRNNQFALVITDVLMPDTDGFELVDYIRNADDMPQSLPIIAISGGGKSVSADDLLSSLEEKVDLILKKPFSKKELLDNVAELIQHENDKKHSVS